MMTHKSFLASCLVVIFCLSCPMPADASAIVGQFHLPFRVRYYPHPRESGDPQPYRWGQRIFSTTLGKCTIGSIQRGKHVFAARNLRMVVWNLAWDDLNAGPDFEDVFIMGS